MAATTARKLVVEVVQARNLLPKDGTGTSSPYVRADFDGQRRKTRTVTKDLNPVWNEALEFDFATAADEVLEVAVLHDVRVGPNRRNNFLGRVRLDARQSVRKGEVPLVYLPLEEKCFFNWVRGDIGLKVYYVDVPLAPPEPPAAGDAAPDAAAAEAEAPLLAEATATASKDDELPKAEEQEGAASEPPSEVAAAAAADGAATEKPPKVDLTLTGEAEALTDASVATVEVVTAVEDVLPKEELHSTQLPPMPMPANYLVESLVLVELKPEPTATSDGVPDAGAAEGASAVAPPANADEPPKAEELVDVTKSDAGKDALLSASDEMGTPRMSTPMYYFDEPLVSPEPEPEPPAATDATPGVGVVEAAAAEEASKAEEPVDAALALALSTEAGSDGATTEEIPVDDSAVETRVL